MERFAGICVAFAFLGCYFLYSGCCDLARAARISTTPREVRLQELISTPPTAEEYVRVSDFTLGQTFISVKLGHDPIGNGCVPAFAPGGGTALFTLDSLSAQFLSDNEPLTGIAMPGGLPRDEAELLNEDYPGHNFTNVVVFRVNGQPPKSSQGWSQILGGCLLFSPLGIMLVVAMMIDRRKRQAKLAEAKQGIPPLHAEASPDPAAPPSARQELLAVLEEISMLLTFTRPDMEWTGWSTAAEARQEIHGLIQAVRSGRHVPLENISVLFLPTGPLQEVSLRKGWGEAFLRMAKRADAAIAAMKSSQS